MSFFQNSQGRGQVCVAELPGHFEGLAHPKVLRLQLPMKELASARIGCLQIDSGPWPSLPRCILLRAPHIRKGRNGKVLKRWSGIEWETHLQCAPAVGVDDGFTLSPEQVRYPGREFDSKTLCISIDELIYTDSSVKQI